MAETNKLQIAMFPWLAFGHIIPFLELAKRMAQKGHQISFISTPRNIQRLPNLALHPLINLVSLPLPQVDNLPENGEATIDVPCNKIQYLKKAFDGLQEPITRFLETSKPDWIIYDFAPHWLPPIATKFGISRAILCIFNASFLSYVLSPSSSGTTSGDDPDPNPDPDPDPRTAPEHFTVPPKWIPFPTSMAFHLYEAKKFFFDTTEVNVSGVSDMFRFSLAIMGCDVLLLRSCRELESDYLNLLSELHHKPVLPVGLLPPIVQDSKDDTWLKISDFLEKHDKGSVIYVALGSEVTPNEDELTELALGLELSGLPFFWALRKRVGVDSDGLPTGFKDRVKGHGIVWPGWAPQLKILTHESIGGFLTHCGWGSIIEGLQHGHALSMFSLSIDQGLNARVLEEKKVGIEIPRDKQDGSFTRQSVAKSLRLVMVDNEGKTYKDKASEMRKIFGDKERHEQYIDDFVEYLKKHGPIQKSTTLPLT